MKKCKKKYSAKFIVVKENTLTKYGDSSLRNRYLYIHVECEKGIVLKRTVLQCDEGCPEKDNLSHIVAAADGDGWLKLLLLVMAG